MFYTYVHINIRGINKLSDNLRYNIQIRNLRYVRYYHIYLIIVFIVYYCIYLQNKSFQEKQLIISKPQFLDYDINNIYLFRFLNRLDKILIILVLGLISTLKQNFLWSVIRIFGDCREIFYLCLRIVLFYKYLFFQIKLGMQHNNNNCIPNQFKKISIFLWRFNRNLGDYQLIFYLHVLKKVHVFHFIMYVINILRF
eukprot:TRINITY_DN24539_c0_g1_i3.p3 TRINITY_DN24539_c0_g1~~TRINITY_DN24539_c0_g1_i3.p3  ORF type:complete len:197 (-),score=-13.39 TRINITY_DN24539_c0_g1_i3:254-844(-)